MPTGYTADVVNGKITDLRTFALQCARGMGALYSMRDDPWDAPIPERFEASDYHAKKLAEATAERDRLYALTDEAATTEARAEYDEEIASIARYDAKMDEQRARYRAMIALVEPWQKAPEGLKEFMLGQLRDGMNFDCPDNYNRPYRTAPELLSGSNWRQAKIEEAQRNIEYHSVEDAKERARIDGRNAWIAQLRAALPDEVSAA